MRPRFLTGTNLNDFKGRPQTTNLGASPQLSHRMTVNERGPTSSIVRENHRFCWNSPESLTAHNGLVAGSSPAGPTTHSFETRDFPERAAERRVGGLSREARSLEKAKGNDCTFRHRFLWSPNPVSRKQRRGCGDWFDRVVIERRGRALGAGVTIRLEDRRAGRLPSREGACLRWPL